MKRTGSAQWSGDLKTGKGQISTESGALNALPYGFNTRFGDEKGTNPEELIGAAHAACFSMALSAELGKANIKPDKIETKAVIELKQQDGGFAITSSHLDVTV
jgi:osmotically inducible protein OsmC